MLSKSLLAVSGLLSLAVAVPGQHGHHEHHHQHHVEKRDLVWVTETDVAVVTIPVTETVWLEPGETPPADSSAPGAPPAAYTQAPGPESSYVPPAPAPSSSSSSSSSPPSSSTSSPSSTYVAPAPTSTSQYVPPPAPTTSSTSEYVPPPAPPSSTYVAPAAPSSSSSPPAAAPSSGNSGTSNSNAGGGSGLASGLAAAGTSYSGDLTYYDTGLGACGISSGSADAIVAISHVIFDSYPAANPNLNPVCGRKVSITGADGSSYTATVVDRCVGCKEGDLDLSQGFFNKVTGNGDGRVGGMKWSWL